MPSGPHELFPSTHWSLVERAGHADSHVRREALSELVRRYLRPLRVHLVNRRRIDPHDADDLLQMFLVSRVLESDLLGGATPGRGRFRNYLLKSVELFTANVLRERATAKRVAERTVSLDQQPTPVDPAPTPADSYEAAWAREVLEQALLRMKAECERGERPDVWGVFEGRVLTATLDLAEAVDYDTLARRFGLASTVQAANILVTGKRMFARSLRSIIGEYEDGEIDVNAEIADLWAALALGGQINRFDGD